MIYIPITVWLVPGLIIEPLSENKSQPCLNSREVVLADNVTDLQSYQ